MGKTELTKALAEAVFGSENALIRVDMSEFMEKHSISRLIGSPPGYVGFEEGGQLSEKIRRNPYSVVLFDEIEKAHPDVFNILLQVLDDGRLTDNKGRTADFKNTILIMTSNLKEEELRMAMRPEFLNRIDEIVTFSQLTKQDIKDILRLQEAILARKMEEKGVRIVFTDGFDEYMSDKGYEPEFGARPVKRVLQRELINQLATAILEGTVRRDTDIIVDNVGGRIEIRNA